MPATIFTCTEGDLPALQQLMIERLALAEKLDATLEFTKAEVVWAARFEMARTV